MNKLRAFPGWKTIVCLLIYSLIGLSAEATCRLQTGLSVGSGIISGQTAYSVGGHILTSAGGHQAPFPISRLVFPIDIDLFTLGAGFVINDRLECSFDWIQNISNDPGKMRDYDWEIYSGQMSIFSESRLDMDARMFSGKIQYPVFLGNLDQFAVFFHQSDQWRLLIGAEYLFRRFDFNAYDTLQTYPGRNTGPDFVAGRTLAYTVDFLIPLVEMGMTIKTAGGSSAELNFGYSPYTRARDLDRHLLRAMRSEADCEGSAFLLSCDFKFVFLKQWFAALHLSHLQIEADGTSRTVIDNEWDHTIDTEIKSRQSLATFRIGAGF